MRTTACRWVNRTTCEQSLAENECWAPGSSMSDTVKRLLIYTDGACDPNPGPGGYGVVIIAGGRREELSGGYRLTTNNRMELTAAIKGLERLKSTSSVRLYSDSKYVVQAMTEGWVQRWQSMGWMRNRREKALNADLWKILLSLCKKHQVEFVWVRGHAGNKENERCDWLSYEALKKPGLPPDEVYEKETTKQPGFRL